MDFEFTEEQKMLQQTLEKFFEKECPKEKIREFDEMDIFPTEIYEKLARLGITGLTIPVEYGGTGRDVVGTMMVVEEISRWYPALARIYVMCALYGGENINNFGTPGQKNKYLPRLAKGELLFSYASTEPNAGSDLGAVESTASLRENVYIINGTKSLITGADYSDYLLTLVRTDKHLPDKEGFTMFILNSRAKGISVHPLKKLGYKCSSLCEVKLRNVEVLEDEILGGRQAFNGGWSQLLQNLDIEHIQIAASGLGIARAVFEDAFKYARMREQFGQPIGKFQAIRHILSEITTQIQAAKILTYHAACLVDKKKPYTMEASMAKLLASEMAKRVAMMGRRILGGYGYMMEYDMQRYVRDALALLSAGQTNQIQKNLIANQLGL